MLPLRSFFGSTRVRYSNSVNPDLGITISKIVVFLQTERRNNDFNWLEYITRGQAWLKESRAGHLKFLVRGTKKTCSASRNPPHFQNWAQTSGRRGGGRAWLKKSVLHQSQTCNFGGGYPGYSTENGFWGVFLFLFDG